MKLRRAMAAVAATAAIAPIALLSAPAAYATGDTADETPAAVAETPDPSKSTAEGDPAKTPTGTPDPSKTPTGKPTPTQTPTQTQTPTGKPTPTQTPTQTQTPTGKPTPTATDEPTDEPTDCPVDDDGVDVDSDLKIELTGLPGKIVAGSGWHEFQLTAANPTDKTLGEVNWIAAVDNFSDSDSEKNWLSNYADLQYWDPAAKSWTSIDGDLNGGLAFGVTSELGPKDKVAVKLRLDVSAKAPTGEGYAIGLGGYVDSEANCVHNSFAYYPLTILKPGSTNENPGTPTPKPDVKPSDVKVPQGGAKELPVTGSLAETGSSSMLPTIGLVGGAAVAVGAGAMFVVRRRKADTAA
ncbi:LAETG motif-containing sortase-dependent surface protein [Streptomyces sp. NPDC050703]|uniref:LAETG motif-containing sortase-dependent surface protein n=1 Tax=Streptomyces sp. NPDC050703 TaxID=3157218 RepID=UPI0034416374